MAQNDPTLIPLEADAPSSPWVPADPAANGLEAELLLVRNDGDGYKPTITLERFPSTDPGDLVAIADRTVADVGEDGTLVDREVGDGFVSQTIAFESAGHRLKLAEAVLRWVAEDPALVDTCVVARLICTVDQESTAGADFATLVTSLQPDVAVG